LAESYVQYYIVTITLYNKILYAIVSYTFVVWTLGWAARRVSSW